MKLKLSPKARKIMKLGAALFLCFFLWAWIAGAQKYKYPDKEDLNLKVNYLERVIKEPLEASYDLGNLKKQNTEWALFTLSYTTYALTNIANLDTSNKARAVAIIDKAIQQACSYPIYNIFCKGDPRTSIDDRGSVLYYGHLNLMLGCYRLLSSNGKYNDLNDSLSYSLYQRYQRATYKCLQSYPGMIWIPDNTVAMASLKLHNQNTGSHLEEMCTEWLAYATTHYIDERTKLLCSTVNSTTGAAGEEPRGSMLGWSIFFMYRFAPEFAKEQYDIYQKKLSTNWLFTRLYRERYKSWKTGLGDIDSGPLFLGYSIPASSFAFGDAVAMKDWRNAKRLRRLISIGSKKVKDNDELKYKIRFTSLNARPMQEALILYFETMTEWRKLSE